MTQALWLQGQALQIISAKDKTTHGATTEALHQPHESVPLTRKEFIIKKVSDQNCRTPSLVTVRKNPFFLNRWDKNATFTTSLPWCLQMVRSKHTTLKESICMNHEPKKRQDRGSVGTATSVCMCAHLHTPRNCRQFRGTWDSAPSPSGLQLNQQRPQDNEPQWRIGCVVQW